MYTTHQIGEYLRIHPLSVERWIITGELPAHKRRTGSTLEWVVSKENLLNYLADLNGGGLPFSIPLCS